MSEMHWPEITRDTPLTEVKRIHQAIWDYVIEHGDKPITPYHCDCALCEWVFKNDTTEYFSTLNCHSKCPVLWPHSHGCMTSLNDGLYDLWCAELNRGLSTKTAQQIRDLPFKYELGKDKMEEKKNA